MWKGNGRALLLLCICTASAPLTRRSRLQCETGVSHHELCRENIGVLWKAPQAEPRHNLLTRCWQASAWQTNAMQEVATFPSPQRKFANLGARKGLLSTSLLEIAKTLFLSPQKSEGISTFSERRLQVFPICCYSLAVATGKQAFWRRVLRRPHPARREVTCGDTDMDWPRLGAVLHTPGLWGRSCLGVRRRAASRAEDVPGGEALTVTLRSPRVPAGGPLLEPDIPVRVAAEGANPFRKERLDRIEVMLIRTQQAHESSTKWSLDT